MRSVMRGVGLAAGLLALGGCAVGPDYAPPVAVQPAGAFARAGTARAEAPVARWWLGLHDAQLAALIERGLANAPQIAIAEARLHQAQAGLAGSRAALLPTLGTSAAYLHADLPGAGLQGLNQFYNLGFDANWEVDLWGGKHRAVEQSRAGVGAALAERGDAEVALAAEIARTYVTMRAREASGVLLAERRGLEAQDLRLGEARLAAGTVARQTVEALRAQLGQTEGEQAAVAGDSAALHDALAVLTGQVPGALDGLVAAPVPLPPVEVSVGDPAGLIARRPDVRAADRAYAAATAGVGVAQARRYPAISLFGVVGLGGTSAGNMLDPSKYASLLVPTLQWSFPDLGRVAVGIRGAKASRELALAQYRAAAVSALQDSESALARYGAARVGWAKSGAAAAHATEIARLQAMRADAGAIAQGDAIDAARGRVNARLAEVNSRASLTIAYVALSKALGLGWDAGVAR
jgi:NodT family efflux transporter outer membrane factor (OMF) lipoprotein